MIVTESLSILFDQVKLKFFTFANIKIMEAYLELPAIVEQQNPDTYQYDNNSKPYRFTRLYLNNYDANIGKDKGPTGEEDKPM